MEIFGSLFTLLLQQEEAAEAALTLVSNAVVLAVDAHGALLGGTLRHPVLDLMEGGRRVRVQT